MTLSTESAGDQLFLRMSRQIPPLSLYESVLRRENNRQPCHEQISGRSLTSGGGTHDVAVINLGCEMKPGSREGIVGRELDVDLRRTKSIGDVSDVSSLE